MEIFEPFMLNGFVSLSGDNCPPTPIKILRDTGASQSLILADILPFSEKTSSDTSVLIQVVECGTVNIPSITLICHQIWLLGLWLLVLHLPYHLKVSIYC